MTALPQAPRKSFEHTEQGTTRPDPYHWLRDVTSDEVLAHLRAERTWYDTATGHLSSFVETLRSEMMGRTPAADSSVSWRLGNSSYYTHLPAGRDYKQLLRDLNTFREPFQADPEDRRGADDGFLRDTQLLLDANDLAAGADHVELGLLLVSPDERLLAWSVDLVGDEVYRLRFRDLDTGRDLTDEVPRSYYGGAWSADSTTFFYTVHDEAYRPFQVWRHSVGSPVGDDVLVLEEPDQRFELTVRAARSGRAVLVTALSRDTREVWFVDSRSFETAPRSIGGRRSGVEYDAEHLLLPDGSEQLLLVTNDEAEEFRLVRAPVPRAGHQDHVVWEPVRKEDPAERLESADAFAGHVVLSFRSEAEHRLRVLGVDDLAGAGFVVRPAFAAGTVELGPNEQYDAAAVTVADQSYVHPCVWSDVDLTTGSRVERHRQEAPGHDPDDYVCERHSFPAPDGTSVPATVVRRRDTRLDGSAPALVYGYGAYEATFEPEWDAALPSLLDREVVFVHAHVRGGGEGGRRWWLDGRLGRKQNTFTDQAAVADGLAAQGLVDGSRIATRGLSAGGLLMGAVFSQRPDRWRAVVAEVPFVDVVNTMFDASVPLTVQEWDEWGDPRDPEHLSWLLAYSPYDNLPPAGGRPDLLVTGAVHDPRVMVWEPAKWVAALRHSDPEWSPRCLFRCETGAGAHAGPSGRFSRLRYEAEVCAWLLDRLEVSA
ncbi:MAG TPA: prolyl oligopeptidase family serine peptidase [Marmoricola sp.]|nr:prolyl oligopeptidase family serine peptidase [Marmoricola sp.]